MMRQMVTYFVAAAICVIFASATPAFGTEDDSFMGLVKNNEDVYITAQDLAFILATHNYDATPEDGYVIVRQDGKTYMLVPNGAASGLADVSVIG
jgi:hypothetical protein